MSTNYYLVSKNQEWVHTYFDDYILSEYPYLGFKIHIGKRSSGWKPAFQVNYPAWTSVKDMLEFLYEHEDMYELFDEYDRKISIQGLKENLIDWQGERDGYYDYKDKEGYRFLRGDFS